MALKRISSRVGNLRLRIVSQITIETDAIDEMYREIQSRAPNMLHPNSKSVETKPSGARQFGVLDKTGVCVVFQQW
jgi:hypothetical protein